MSLQTVKIAARPLIVVLTASVLASVLLAAPARAQSPVFTDVTDAAGIQHVQTVLRWSPDCVFQPACDMERMTGGAAAGDVNGDGAVDLFVTRLDAPDLLYVNQGDGTFADASAAGGLGAFDLHSNGAALCDLDNDGDLDLYVTTIGMAGDAANNRNYLFMNRGDGVFTEEAVTRGAAVASDLARRGFSVACGDYDRDGWLDLHTTEWLPASPSHARLLRNRGPSAPASFDDVTAAAGVSLDGVHAFASTFTDLDGDRWPDLAVVADFRTSRLFWNNGDGTFTDGTRLAGVGSEDNGMGSTFGDVDADGDLDWFVTSIWQTGCPGPTCSISRTGNRLFLNRGERVFEDVTDLWGVRDGDWGWGAAFFDYDNDTDLDLVMTNGIDLVDQPDQPVFITDPMRLWENHAGAMREVSVAAGLQDTELGKGLLILDHDGDGDRDLFVVNTGAAPRLYRNDGGNLGDWLRVRVVGTRSNRDGIGARVRVRATASGPEMVREIGTCTHFMGQSEPGAHFGLGAAGGPVASVIVEWPGGATQCVSGVARNSTLVLREPDRLDSRESGDCRADRRVPRRLRRGPGSGGAQRRRGGAVRP